MEYYNFRVITVCLSLALFPYLLFSGNNVGKGDLFLIIILTVLYRSCDAFSDLFQGLFQQIHERLDIAGKLMVLRYGSSTIILISLLLSNSLIFFFNLFMFF